MKDLLANVSLIRVPVIRHNPTTNLRTINPETQQMRQYYVYIMASKYRVLYVGVTNDLIRRVAEHKEEKIAGFTQRYSVTRLVYYDATPDIRSAIEREKQIKGWLRSRKIKLIESMNPDWRDLADDLIPSE